MPCFALTVSYVGTRYAGWQIQDKAQGPPTIQGELEKVLTKVVGTLVRVHGAGRTDSGVHAEGQVAHVHIAAEKAHLDWQRIFNTQLPSDITVLSMVPVHEGFHSRFDAQHKTYVYTFWTERRYMPPRLRPFAWDCGALDIEAMHEAIPFLCGRHDFACLQNAGTPIQDTVRTVHSVQITRGSPWLPPVWHESALRLTVTADGFLKQMVRNMAGLLCAVGRHRFDAAQIPALFATGRRSAAPCTAPACGLTLQHVQYVSSLFSRPHT